jgi:ketosteroid isomerase-like protein
MELLSSPMKFLFVSAAVLLVSPGFIATAASGNGTAESLAGAEKAFARESVEKGMRTAFLNALSDDGVVFDPGPGGQNGKKVWQTQKESVAVLEWQPVLAVIASSGDLGYTTGPWNYRNYPNEKPGAFGEFVSVWRRENGNWKLLCDIGANHPPPAAPAPELKLINLPHPRHAKPAQFSDLQKHDRDYALNRATHFEAVAADEVRVYESGKFPALGKTGGLEALKAATDTIAFGESKGGLSQDGDLGFVWGDYSLGDAAASGDYLRIWRRDEEGAWKLTLDLLRRR